MSCSKVTSQVDSLVDVDEKSLKWNVADGFLEEDVDDRRRADVPQTAEHEQQFAEASRLSGIVSLGVLAERHLSLVL